MKQFIVGLALCLAVPAWAGRVYINAASIKGGNSFNGSGGSATRVDNDPGTGVAPTTQWCFAASGNQTAYYEFPLPGDAPAAFTPVFQLYAAGVPDGNVARLAITMVDVSDASDITTITGTEVLSYSYTEFTPVGFNAAQLIVGIPDTVYKANTVPCTGATVCQNRDVVARIQRINTNDVCIAAHQPYQCCHGAAGDGLNTCAPATNYGDSICIVQVDERY